MMLSAALAVLAAACANPVRVDGRDISVDTTALDFGAVARGTRASQQILFSNVSRAQRVLDLRLEDSDAGQFALSRNQLTIEPGQSAALEVTIAPTLVGQLRAHIIYTAGPEQDAVELSGAGAGPRLSVPEGIDFGSDFGVRTRRLKVVNLGIDLPDTSAGNLLLAKPGADGTWSPAAPQVEGADAADFSIEWPPAGYSPELGLAAGESVEVVARFSPSALGLRSAALRIFSNDPLAAEVVIPLSGVKTPLVSCDFEVLPQALQFQADLGQRETRSIRIRNTSAALDHPCFVFGFAVSASSAFVVKTDLEAVISVGDVVDLPVEFAPTAEGEAAGELRFRVGTSEVSVALNGSARAPFELQPDTLDFGAVVCAGGAKLVTVRAVGASPTRIESVELVGADFKFVRKPLLPRTLQPGETAELELAVVPGTLGEKIARLVVKGNGYSAEMPVRVERIGYPSPWTDVYENPPIPVLDVLLVIDDSPSMADKQQALAANLESLFRFADSQQLDYHFAVTTTAVDAAHGGACSGPDLANGRFLPLDGSGPRVITRTTPDKVAAFARNIAVGASTPCDGNLLRPMLLSLSEPLLRTHNAGFLRPDANLAVIVVSDGADLDGEPVSSVANFLFGIKGFRRINAVSFSAIIPTRAQPSSGCTYDTPDAGLSSRTKDLVVATGGVYDDICAPNWETTLEHSGTDTFWYRTRFFLSQEPDLSVTPIIVAIDGEPVPAVAASGEARWRYDEVLNSIDFDPVAAPLLGSTIAITYSPRCP